MENAAFVVPPLLIGSRVPSGEKQAAMLSSIEPVVNSSRPDPSGLTRSTSHGIWVLRGMFKHLARIAGHHGQDLAVGGPVPHQVGLRDRQHGCLAGVDIDDDVVDLTILQTVNGQPRPVR